MAPKVVESKIANVPPSFYAKGGRDTPQAWLDAKRDDDNVEDGLWRIHNTLYDLTDFIPSHPGGPDWLRMTKGHDITEAFVTHHLAMEKVQPFLAKYRVRETIRPRNVKLTFNEDGFYMTLRKRVMADLPEIRAKTKVYSEFYIDGLFVLVLLTAILTQRFQSVAMAFLCGLFYTWCGICGHNFLHMRDNFRMYYINIMFMNYRNWRITHALSHHLYPNSLLDFELTDMEPFFVYLPNKHCKNFVQRYISYIYSPFLYSVYFLRVFVLRIKTVVSQGKTMHFDEFLPFVVPTVMWLFGGDHSILATLKMFLVIVLAAGLVFGVAAINSGHHHPSILHDGDAVRKSFDWGLYIMDTIMDRQELRGNTFMALTNFGDHALHHLFPTLDSGLLGQLYDILFQTLIEFEAESHCYPWYEAMKGQFLQMTRIEPMTLDPHERYLVKMAERKQQ